VFGEEMVEDEWPGIIIAIDYAKSVIRQMKARCEQKKMYFKLIERAIKRSPFPLYTLTLTLTLTFLLIPLHLFYVLTFSFSNSNLVLTNSSTKKWIVEKW
jgi:hypothetical protein